MLMYVLQLNNHNILKDIYLYVKIWHLRAVWHAIISIDRVIGTDSNFHLILRAITNLHSATTSLDLRFLKSIVIVFVLSSRAWNFSFRHLVEKCLLWRENNGVNGCELLHNCSISLWLLLFFNTSSSEMLELQSKLFSKTFVRTNIKLQLIIK